METALQLIHYNLGISLAWLISNAGGKIIHQKAVCQTQEVVAETQSSCVNTVRRDKTWGFALSWFYARTHAQSGRWSKSHSCRMQLEPSRLVAFDSTSKASSLTLNSQVSAPPSVPALTL